MSDDGEKFGLTKTSSEGILQPETMTQEPSPDNQLLEPMKVFSRFWKSLWSLRTASFVTKYGGFMLKL